MKTEAKRGPGRPKTGEYPKRLAVRLTGPQWTAIQAEMDRTGDNMTDVILARLFSGTRKNPTLKPA